MMKSDFMKFILTLILVTVAHSCAKSTNPMDPSLQVFFVEQPRVTASYSASFDYSVKLSRDAVLYYVAVPSGSLAPSAQEIRNGFAFGAQKPLSAGKFSFVTGTSNTGAVVPDTNTTYDIYMTAQPRGGLDIMLTSAQKVTGTTSVSGYSMIAKWGTNGAGNGQFLSPVGVAVDSRGFVYTAEGSTNDRIQIFDPSGNFVSKLQASGSGNGQFDSTYDIDFDQYGNIYVSDFGNDRIQKFTSSFGFLLKWGTGGTGDGQFSDPRGIAVDPTSRYIYVADHGNNRVQKFTVDGLFVTRWGTNGTGNGQFSGPSGIAVDNQGYVYVAENNNRRVQKFTPDGAFVLKWGTSGSGDGQFNTPYGIAVDAADNVYVADRGNTRVQKFTSSGVYITQWGGILANGIAVDSIGNVYVTEGMNDDIMKFR